MRKTRIGLILLTILLAACAARHPSSMTAVTDTQQQAKIRQLLSNICDAAEKKDFDRLDSYHFYGPKFTKFGTESNVRQDAVAARNLEHTGLASANSLSMQLEDLKIDVLGNAAVATFLLDYSFQAGSDTVRKQARATMVFVQDGATWKIVHEHLSAAKPN